MKHDVWKKTLCVVLAVLAAAQWAFCASAVTTDDTDAVRIYRYVYDVNDDGSWTHGYMTDAAGNRVQWGADGDAFVTAQSVFPDAYDLREQFLVTSVKDQCNSGTCWAFGAVAAAESNYILQGYGTAKDTDFSEAHLVWFAHRPRSTDPTDPLYGEGYSYDNPFEYGGRWEYVAPTLMRGSGLQTEKKAAWNEPKSAEESMKMAQPESERYAGAAQLWSMESLWEINESAIKLKIMQNGAAALAFWMDTKHYNKQHQCMFQNKYAFGNHEVCVVGWDDNFSRKNFSNPRPKSDGAWLIKNSWGKDLSKDGYFWLSYEDPSIVDVESYIMAPADIYDNRYQYDAVCPQSMIVGSASAKMANVFTARKAEELTHVAFCSFNPYPMPVTAEVYVADADAEIRADQPLSGMRKVDAATTTVGNVGLGYFTAELREPVTLEAGERFAVVVTIKNPLGEDVGIPVEGERMWGVDAPASLCANTGESFIFVDDTWQDTTAFYDEDLEETINLHNVPVKAMTRDLDADAPTLTVLHEPEKKAYMIGDTPDLTGLTLLYTAADGTQTVIDQDFDCLTSTIENIGTVPVILSYQGLRAAYTVQVQAGTISMTMPKPEKTTLLYGDLIEIAPDVQGAAENAELYVKCDLLVNGTPYWYSPYIQAGESIYLDAVGSNKVKSYTIITTLTDRFGNTITGADGEPITAQQDYTLKCGPFYQFLYRIRLFFESIFRFFRRF